MPKIRGLLKMENVQAIGTQGIHLQIDVSPDSRAVTFKLQSDTPIHALNAIRALNDFVSREVVRLGIPPELLKMQPGESFNPEAPNAH